MDYQTHNTRSNGLAIASLTMGILSLATSCFIYTAVPFGALAIIFSLLSRGIEHDLDPKALAGLLLGIIGLIVAVIVLLLCLSTPSTIMAGLITCCSILPILAISICRCTNRISELF